MFSGLTGIGKRRPTTGTAAIRTQAVPKDPRRRSNIPMTSGPMPDAIREMKRDIGLAGAAYALPMNSQIGAGYGFPGRGPNPKPKPPAQGTRVMVDGRQAA